MIKVNRNQSWTSRQHRLLKIIIKIENKSQGRAVSLVMPLRADKSNQRNRVMSGHGHGASDGKPVGGPGGLSWTTGGEWAEFCWEWVMTAMTHSFGPTYGYHRPIMALLYRLGYRMSLSTAANLKQTCTVGPYCNIIVLACNIMWSKQTHKNCSMF